MKASQKVETSISDTFNVISKLPELKVPDSLISTIDLLTKPTKDMIPEIDFSEVTFIASFVGNNVVKPR